MARNVSPRKSVTTSTTLPLQNRSELSYRGVCRHAVQHTAHSPYGAAPDRETCASPSATNPSRSPALEAVQRSFVYLQYSDFTISCQVSVYRSESFKEIAHRFCQTPTDPTRLILGSVC